MSLQLPRTVKSVNFNNYNTVTLRTLLLLHAARQLKGSVSCSGVDSAAAWNKGSSLLLASSLRSSFQGYRGFIHYRFLALLSYSLLLASCLRSSFQGYRGFIHYRFLALLSYSLLLASCLRSSFQGYKEFTRFLSLLSYFPQTFSKCTFYPRFLSSILPYFPIFHLLYYSIIFSSFPRSYSVYLFHLVISFTSCFLLLIFFIVSFLFCFFSFFFLFLFFFFLVFYFLFSFLFSFLFFLIFSFLFLPPVLYLNHFHTFFLFLFSPFKRADF